MSTPPRVGVVIPSHNDLPTLRQAVASALAQSLSAAEVIVVSDASDDGTDAWLALQAHAGVRFRSIDARSPAAARNAGVAMAKTPYVAFLDSDDVWDRDRLALFALQLAKRPDGVLWACTWRREGLRLAPLPTPTWVDRHSRAVPAAAFLGMNRFQTSTVVVRREAILLAGGFNPEMDGAEDWDLWTRIAARGRVWLTPAPLVTYRTGHGRVSSDGGRVYRQGLRMLMREGADVRALAWHHLRFGYAFRRQGAVALAAEARAAMPTLHPLQAVGLRLRFALYLAARAWARSALALQLALGR